MSDSPDKTTHAQRRKKEAQEAVRLRLRSGQYIRRLTEICNKAEIVEPSMIPALRLKADIYCKLLAKCLPDLKAIEHSGHVHQTYDTSVLALINGRTEARDAPSAEPTTH